jgi:D-glucosaminate-6-phosphate ammonia-lyase
MDANMTDRKILNEIGLTPVINAIGYATPLGNSRQSAEVIAAVAEASANFISMAQLQKKASERLAEITHAEAGYVVSGAAAGLTLATAATMTGLDPVRMNLLPETANGTPSTVVMHRSHRYDYDHAIRQAGASLKEVGFPNLTFPYELEAAIDDETAAVFFRGDGSRNVVPFEQVIAIAHAHNVPVIVDAALTVPPLKNLWYFTDAGADLVVFSGGKAIGGPPASGFVVGRSDLIASIALQHQDMDVRLETWDPGTLASDQVTNPPYQGIGRPMKVGKEQVVGLLVALDRYVKRNHEADLISWRDRCQRIYQALAAAIENLEMTIEEGTFDTEIYVPQVYINLGSPEQASEVSAALHGREPAVHCYEGSLWRGGLIISPTTIRLDEEETLIKALIEEIATVRSANR